MSVASIINPATGKIRPEYLPPSGPVTVPTLASVLAVGNTTGANDILMSNGLIKTAVKNAQLVEADTVKVDILQAGIGALSDVIKVEANLNLKEGVNPGIGVLEFELCDGVIATQATKSLTLDTDTLKIDGISATTGVANVLTYNATTKEVKYQPSSVPGGESLAQTLAFGNTSGTNDILMDAGQKISVNSLTDVQTITNNPSNPVNINSYQFSPNANLLGFNPPNPQITIGITPETIALNNTEKGKKAEIKIDNTSELHLADFQLVPGIELETSLKVDSLIFQGDNDRDCKLETNTIPGQAPTLTLRLVDDSATYKSDRAQFNGNNNQGSYGQQLAQLTNFTNDATSRIIPGKIFTFNQNTGATIPSITVDGVNTNIIITRNQTVPAVFTETFTATREGISMGGDGIKEISLLTNAVDEGEPTLFMKDGPTTMTIVPFGTYPVLATNNAFYTASGMGIRTTPNTTSVQITDNNLSFFNIPSYGLGNPVISLNGASGRAQINGNGIGFNTSENLLLTNINATAGTKQGVPSIKFEKLGRNAVAGDTIGSQHYFAKNDTGAITEFARVEAEVRNTGGANDDGALSFSGLVNGGMTEFLRLNGADSEVNVFQPLDLNNNSLKTSNGSLSISAQNSTGAGKITLATKDATGAIEITGNQITFATSGVASGRFLRIFLPNAVGVLTPYKIALFND